MGYFREYGVAFIKTFFLLHRLLLRGRVHVVHVANPPDIFWPLALYLKLFGIRFIFDEHDLSPEAYLSRFDKEESDAGMLYTIQRWFQKLSYRFADAILSTNETYRERAIADRSAECEEDVRRAQRSGYTDLPEYAAESGAEKGAEVSWRHTSVSWPFRTGWSISSGPWMNW